MWNLLREIKSAVMQLAQDVRDLGMFLLTFRKRLDDIREEQLEQSRVLLAIRDELRQQGAEREDFEQHTTANLDQIFNFLKHGPVAVGFRFLVEVVGTDQTHTLEGGAGMSDIKRTTKLRLTPTPVDRDGFPASYDTERAITVESSDPSIVSVIPDPDTPGAFLIDTPGAPNLDAILTATGDAVPGPDESLFHGTLALHLIPADAIGFAMNVTPI